MNSHESLVISHGATDTAEVNLFCEIPKMQQATAMDKDLPKHHCVFFFNSMMTNNCSNE